MERSTMFHGKTHYFDWAIFNSELLNYQRVTWECAFAMFDYQTEVSNLAIQRCLEIPKCGQCLDECYMPYLQHVPPSMQLPTFRLNSFSNDLGISSKIFNGYFLDSYSGYFCGYTHIIQSQDISRTHRDVIYWLTSDQMSLSNLPHPPLG